MSTVANSSNGSSSSEATAGAAAVVPAAEPKTGGERLVPVVCPGHSRPLAELHFSPKTPDGVFLISACLDKLPMLRDGETGDWIGTFSGHKGAVWSAKLNKDATKAVTASADFSVKLWDAVSGKELHTFAHKHIVKTVDFSGDGQKIISGGMEKVLRVDDLAALDKAPQILKGKSAIRKSLWRNQNEVITGTDKGTVDIWDLRTSKLSKSIPVGKEQSRVMDLELSTNNILTVASGKSVTFFDQRTLKELKRWRYDIEMQAASLHPSGKSFIAGGGRYVGASVRFRDGKGT
eukprot:g3157.t1